MAYAGSFGENNVGNHATATTDYPNASAGSFSNNNPDIYDPPQ